MDNEAAAPPPQAQAPPPPPPAAAPAAPAPPPPARPQAPAPPPAAPALMLPRGLRRPAATSTPGTDNDLLSVTAGLPFSDIEHYEYNLYSPNALIAMYLCSCMDSAMMNTKRFTDNAPLWHPLLTRLYVSMLFYMHLLRNLESANSLTLELNYLLNGLRDLFPFEQLSVPGPLVPFFKSLSVSCPVFPEFGDVVPRLPATPECVPNTHFTLGQGHRFSFPHIPLLIDQYRYLQTTDLPVNVDADQSAPMFANLFGTAMPAAITAEMARLMRNCAVINLDDTPNAQRIAIRAARSRLVLPDMRLLNAMTTTISWSQFLGAEQLPSWFRIVATIMSRYSGFFRGSTNLAAIPAAGLAAPQIPIQLSTNAELDGTAAVRAAIAAAAPAPATIRCARSIQLQHLRATATHCSPSLLPIHEQHALLARPHMYWPGNGANRDGFANRSGPLWTMTTRRERPTFDTITGIANMIAGSYHSDTRLDPTRT